jgi:hypothetical protein
VRAADTELNCWTCTQKNGLMVARFVVLAALILVAEIGGAAAQHFMMGQGTSSCGSWTEAAVSLSGKPDIERTSPND